MRSQVAGPQRDLHSGNDGGVFNEPLADLTKVLASLIDSRNNIQVRRWRTDVAHSRSVLHAALRFPRTRSCRAHPAAPLGLRPNMRPVV